MIDFRQEAEDLFPFTQAIRRDLHQHPELGYKEVRTAGVVIRELSELGLELRTGVAETGVIGIIEGGKPGPVMMLRFDMDALAVTEETGAEYASCYPGSMHACGHDGHVAVGLTVAKILHRHREKIAGTVKLVFQPAEEGLNGAERMIQEGALDQPKPDTSLAIHLWNEKPVGWVEASAGPLMAGSAVLSIRVIGRGGHGALPHETVDPVAAAAQLVTALQTVVSRNISPLDAAVISVTYLRAGEAFNVIPPYAELMGTIRWFKPEVQKLIFQRVRQLAEEISTAMGCTAEVEIKDLTPALINDGTVTTRVQQLLQKTLPELQIESSYQTMGSEDMAFFMNAIPGCFLLIGSKNKESSYPHHHPKFDIDERAMSIAATVICAAVFDGLSAST